MSENNTFEVKLNLLAHQPIETWIFKSNRNNSKPYPVEMIKSDSENFKLKINNAPLNEIFIIGEGICYSIATWNKTIENRIKDRSGFDFNGRKLFKGTDAEKSLLNEQDAKLMINFPDGFFENFITEVKEANFEQDNIKIPEEITFEDMLNFEDSTLGMDALYNERYGTKFKISKVYLNDQLFFAEVVGSEISLVDVFCFGYMIAYNDETRYLRYNK